MKKEAIEKLKAEMGATWNANVEKDVKRVYEDLKYQYMRGMITLEKRRIAGRKHDEIRNITSEVGSKQTVGIW